MSQIAESTASVEQTPSSEPASLPWIKKLVSFDTVSRNPNMGLIETVRDELRVAGIDSTLTIDPSGKWANLFATVPAHDGTTNGGIVLSGHTDVVPVDGQKWDSDPFKPEIRDGLLYGRGTCDMKGFIGASLSLLPKMQATKLARPIHFALSFDEEIGCAGAPLMITDLQKRGLRPDGCIVGEPTSMRPIIAHKGINAYNCCVRGFAAHSSLTPQGLNAIEYAARLICFIRDVADEFRAQGLFDEQYDVPFTTAQTSTINGGNAINTVPAECNFAFEFRNLPTLDPEPIYQRIEKYAREKLLPKMQKEHANAAIKFSKIAAAPGLDASEQAAITQLVRALTANQEKRKVAYETEAGLFQLAGVPSIVCGRGISSKRTRRTNTCRWNNSRHARHFWASSFTACRSRHKCVDSMKPSAALALKRDTIRETVGRFRAANPRVFGSVLYGTDQDGSDLDLLVNALPGATLFDLGGLQMELEDMLGVAGFADTGQSTTPVSRARISRSGTGMSDGSRAVSCVRTQFVAPPH